MARVDSLFELIRSLTKSEKRYFKLFAAMQGKEKNYLLLFDAIDAQEVYDEEALKERFRSEKFVRQFSVAKNYLRGLIMKSLRLYHSESTNGYKIREMLMDVEILADKRLTAQARKLATKAAELADRFDKPSLQLEALVRRHGLEIDTTMTPEGLDRMAAEQHAVVERLANLVDYGILVYRAGRVASRGNRVRTPEQIAELDSVMSDPLLASESEALSFRAWMRYHWIHAANHNARGEWEESLRHISAELDALESDPELLREHISVYLAAVSNTLLIVEKLGDRARFDAVLEKFHRQAESAVSGLKRRSRQEGWIFSYFYTRLVGFYMRDAEYEKAIALIPEIERGMKRFGVFIDDLYRLHLRLHLASLHFANRHYVRALDECNQILHDRRRREGDGIRHTAQLLSLLAHYELGHQTLLKHLLVATRRDLRVDNALHGVESLMLDLLDRLIRLKSAAGRTNALVAARDRLLVMNDDLLEAGALHEFGFIDWIESAIQGKTFVAIARERRIVESPWMQPVPQPQPLPAAATAEKNVVRRKRDGESPRVSVG